MTSDHSVNVAGRGGALAPATALRRFALLGNPNTGKTTLFNRLCGMRSRTGNFPGSTVEARFGHYTRQDDRFELVDLPGLYGLNLERPESAICREYLSGHLGGTPAPEALLVIADATNLERNLIFVNQALQQGLPAVVVLTMTDTAERRGVSTDIPKLASRLGCPVVGVCARTGEGVESLVEAMRAPALATGALSDPRDAQRAAEWAGQVHEEVAQIEGDPGPDRLTDRLDRAFTHPILGLAAFVAIMTGLFYAIFALASLPMDLIELLFERLGDLISQVVPEGAVRDLMVDGVVGGIAGTLVFLPQICLLFFLITLLEDTGYLARAAFVIDRLLRRAGLPGQSFIPFLSAHACAIPAIMSARLIPDHRDRLATILVTPFLSCSARLPVYVLLIGVLFGDRPLMAGLAFTGCYVLGALAALVTALIVRRTILRGASRPMVLEFPPYRTPSLRTALLTTWDRASLFVRKAGTVIVGISIVLWWAGEYPRVEMPVALVEQRAAAEARLATEPEAAAEAIVDVERAEAKVRKRESIIGRVGRAVEPVFGPIGADWQLGVGVLSSLLAREVFVTSLNVVIAGDADDDDPERVRARILGATRDDGSPLLTTSSAWSLLVYFVLAMQCLPTLAVTRRETGSWKWAILQFGWMTGVAYVAAVIVRQVLLAAGVT